MRSVECGMRNWSTSHSALGPMTTDLREVIEMRNRYIVSYDISDAQRLRQVHKAVRGFGEALQYSVFSCDLTRAERMLLIEALTEIINLREDQVMVIDLGPSEGRGRESIEAIGRALDEGNRERVAVIV